MNLIFTKIHQFSNTKIQQFTINQYQFMDLQTIEAKQQYLYKEILDQDYDPEEFQQFLSNQKGLQLDDYSMKELIQAVRKFKGVVVSEDSKEKNDNSAQENSLEATSQKAKEAPQSSGQFLENQDKTQNISPQTKNEAIENSQNKSQEPVKPQKFKIDIKKMIIPQYKPKESSNTQQNYVQKSPTKAQQIFGIQKQKLQETKNEPKNQQKVDLLAPKTIKKNLYKEDEEQEDEQKQAFDGFIEDPNMKPGMSFSEYNQNQNYGRSVKESIYIPSESNKNPYIIVKKPNYSSLYKQMKSFIKDSKDGKKVNPFFEGFSIKIREFSKKQSNSIFRFPYVTYNIQTTFPVSKQLQNKTGKSSVTSVTNKVWKVERRFNDFKWIHDFLEKSYYGLPIPPIPLKTKMRSFDDEHLSERMNVFEKFLNKCSHIDEICSDPIFQAFLSIESREELQAVKKKFDNKIKSRDQNMMQFIKGQQILINTKEQSQISANTKNFLAKQTQLLQLLNRQLTNVQNNIKLASEHAVFASNIFRQLSQLYKANHEYEINGSGLLDLTGEYISELSYKLDNEAYYLKNYVSDLWVYEEMYNKNLIYRTQSLDRHKNVLETKFRDYHNVGKSSQLMEESLANSSNTKGSGLYKKTKELYDINLSMFIEEISRHLRQDLLITAKYFLKGVEKHVGLVKDEMMVGVDLMTKIMTVAEGKQLKEVELIGTVIKDREKDMRMKQV